MAWDDTKIPHVSVVAAADYNALVTYVKTLEKKLTISDEEPAGPADSDLWYAPSTGIVSARVSGAWVDLTLSGPAGPQGEQGPQGPPGEDGAQGPQGEQGPQGPPGEIGPQGPQGPAGTDGAQGPQGPQGPQGEQGPQGPAGADGAAGADGKTVLNGAGAPGAGLGVDGDFYIDTSADTIYGPKTAGVWGSATSLIGPQGEQGEPGEDGADGVAATWVAVASFTRASDTSFSVTDNAENLAIFQKGRPIRYRATAGSWAYGIVVNVADAGATLTITLSGAPMTTSYDDELEYGDMSRVVQVPVFIPGYFEDAANTTLIASDLGQELTWGQGTAYLVRVRARNRIADTGATDATVNVYLGGSAALSTGLTLAANATWYTSAVAVSTTNYEVSFDEVIEVSTTKGTNGNAQDLSVQMTFVVV